MALRLAIVGAFLAFSPIGAQAPSDPALPGILRHWFNPKAAEVRTLAQGGVIARALPARGSHISVIAACAVTLTPDVFATRVRNVASAARGPSLSGDFSDPPTHEDLENLSLDQGDIDRLRLCRVGDCRLNLGEEEIATITRSLAGTASGPSPETQEAFRRILLERVRRYRSAGLAGLGAYRDRHEPLSPAAAFDTLIAQSSLLDARLPSISVDLRQHPPGTSDGSAPSLSWSRVIMNGKTVIMITDVRVYRPKPAADLPAVIIAAKQVYASRYMNGSLGLTMLFAGGGGNHYLVHVDRSDLDELNGAFTGLKRSLMEGRIKDEAVAALTSLRTRLESRSAAPASERGGRRLAQD